jgi:hypothetical protein
MLFAAAHRSGRSDSSSREPRYESAKDEWPWGESTDEEAEAYYPRIPERWGQGVAFGYLVPSIGDVE